MLELVSIFNRLNAGKAVREPQDWAECYHDDVSALMSENFDLREYIDLQKDAIAGLLIRVTLPNSIVFIEDIIGHDKWVKMAELKERLFPEAPAKASEEAK